MSHRILHVDNVKTSHMSLPRGDGTNTAQIVATSHHAQVSSLELDKIDNLASVDVISDGVVHFDQRIRVSDGSAIVGHQVGDTFWSSCDLLNSAKFVLQKSTIRIQIENQQIDLLWLLQQRSCEECIGL